MIDLFRPMLCGQSFTELPTNLKGWLASGKLDGWRAVAHRQDEQVQLWGGRNGSEYSGQLSYIDDELLAVLPLDSVVDGELISPLGHGGVASAMSTKVAHVPNAAVPALTYVIFDVLRVDGTDVRRLPLEQRLHLVDRIQAAEHVRTAPLLEPIEVSLEVALEAGLEGVVLKRMGSTYVPTRSPAWAKVKPMLSLDLRIVSLPHDGEGSFAGLVGAVEFELPDGQIGRASGMSMDVRREMTEHPERYVDRIAEISYQLMTKDGRLRHPQFKRLRGDLEKDGTSMERAEGLGGPTIASEAEATGVLGRSMGVSTKERKKLLSTSTQKVKMRNYRAMGLDKLRGCVQDLQQGEGDAYERCVAKGGDPAEDLKVAQAELAKREAA